jgi:hypothetical protein
VSDDLIVNFDETSVFIVPSSQYSMALVGSKQVTVIGKEDKRQITALLTITASGNLLPLQLIYQGKTNQCYPNYELPDDYLVDHTPSHWSDRDSIVRYAKNILLPYFINKRIDLDLPENQVAIVIFDVHASHRYNDELHDILKLNHIQFVYVPACCTSELQPLDADGSPNFRLKQLLKHELSMWYSNVVMKKIDNDIEQKISKFNASLIKPLHVRWFVKSFELLKNDNHRSCWQQTGISQKIEAIRNQ